MTTNPGARRWLGEPVVATALVLAILAAVFAAWSGWSWYRASTAGPPAGAQLRDQVLQAGGKGGAKLNTPALPQGAGGAGPGGGGPPRAPRPPSTPPPPPAPRGGPPR